MELSACPVSVIKEKLFRTKITLFSICEALDLIAVALEDNTVNIFRLEFEEVYTVDLRDSEDEKVSEDDEVVKFSWNLAGSRITVCLKSGLIFILDLKTFNSWFTSRTHFNEIVDASWGSISAITTKRDLLNEFSIDNTITLPRFSKSSSLSRFWSSLLTNDFIAQESSVLLTLDTSGLAMLHLYGLIAMESLTEPTDKLEEAKLIKSIQRNSVDEVTLAKIVGQELVIDNYSSVPNSFSASSKDICLAAKNLWNTKVVIMEAKSLVDKISADMRKYVEKFDRMTMKTLLAKLKEHGSDEISGEEQVKSVLYDFMALGIPIPAFREFILNDLGDAGVKELLKSTSATLEKSVMSALEEVNVVMEHCLAYLTFLSGNANVLKRFGLSSLLPEDLEPVIGKCGAFIEEIVEMKLEVTNMGRNISNFLSWIQEALFLLNREDGEVSSGSIGTSSNVDLELVLDFLRTYEERFLGYNATNFGIDDALQPNTNFCGKLGNLRASIDSLFEKFKTHRIHVEKERKTIPLGFVKRTAGAKAQDPATYYDMDLRECEDGAGYSITLLGKREADEEENLENLNLSISHSVGGDAFSIMHCNILAESTESPLEVLDAKVFDESLVCVLGKGVFEGLNRVVFGFIDWRSAIDAVQSEVGGASVQNIQIERATEVSSDTHKIEISKNRGLACLESAGGRVLTLLDVSEEECEEEEEYDE